MRRREFLLGAAAGVAASSPFAALAAEGPPLSSKAAFVAWMTAKRPSRQQMAVIALAGGAAVGT